MALVFSTVRFLSCISNNLQICLSPGILPSWKVTPFSNFKIKLVLYIDLCIEILLPPVLLHYTALRLWCWQGVCVRVGRWFYATSARLAGVPRGSSGCNTEFKAALSAIILVCQLDRPFGEFSGRLCWGQPHDDLFVCLKSYWQTVTPSNLGAHEDCPLFAESSAFCLRVPVSYIMS